MSKISILGANSYIARNYIYYLNKEHKDSEIKLYGHSDKQIDAYKNYIKIDFSNINELNKIDWNTDYIYIFIGKTGTLNGFIEYENFLDINEKYLLHILNKYIEKKSKAKIIFLSTRLVYKGSKKPLTEDMPKDFKTIYAINKFACENYLKMYNNLYNIPYVILRLCVPYGSYKSGKLSYGLMGFFINKAKSKQDITIFGDGNQKRTLTSMDYLVKVLWEVANNKKIINDVFNIGGETFSLKEVAEKVAKKYAVNLNFIDWPQEALAIETGDTVFNSNKLDKLLGLNYCYRIEDYLKTLD